MDHRPGKTAAGNHLTRFLTSTVVMDLNASIILQIVDVPLQVFQQSSSYPPRSMASVYP
jgi:hypothetical protein